MILWVWVQTISKINSSHFPFFLSFKAVSSMPVDNSRKHNEEMVSWNVSLESRLITRLYIFSLLIIPNRTNKQTKNNNNNKKYSIVLQSQVLIPEVTGARDAPPALAVIRFLVFSASGNNCVITSFSFQLFRNRCYFSSQGDIGPQCLLTLLYGEAWEISLWSCKSTFLPPRILHQYRSHSQASLDSSSGLSSLSSQWHQRLPTYVWLSPQVTRCIIEVLSNALSKSKTPPITPECRQVLKKSKFPALQEIFVPWLVLSSAPSTSSSTLPPHEPGA